MIGVTHRDQIRVNIPTMVGILPILIDRIPHSNYGFNPQYHYNPGCPNRSHTQCDREDANYDYSVDTHNRFFPLRDQVGPIQYDSDNHGYANSDYENSRSGPYRDQFTRPNDRVHEPQYWGFPKPNQGVKRPVENREEAEGGVESNLKKKKI